MTREPVDHRPLEPIATRDDRDAIIAVRDAFVRADNLGDAETMVRLLADDVVILHPYCGGIEGKDAAHAFMGRVLEEVHAEFDKDASYSTIELTVSGDLAFERGALVQKLTPKSGGPIQQDQGMYLWIYVRRGERWQIARIAGTLTTAEESSEEEDK